MLDPSQLARAVDLQRRSYRLLLWTVDAIQRGFLSFRAVHDFASFDVAARSWLEEHYDSFPDDARPPRDYIPDFARLFATYVDSSFDIVESPGKRLFSPGAHCFCPMCSWLVDMPRLQTKRPTTGDKERAAKLRLGALHAVAASIDATLTDAHAGAVVDEAAMFEPLSMVAYARNLFDRMRGVRATPATLVLWRSFAWNREGSPKKDFILTTAAIIAAEATVIARLSAA